MIYRISFIVLLSLKLNSAVVTINAGFPFSPKSVTISAGDTIHIDFLGGFHNAAETNSTVPSNGNIYNGTGFRSGSPGAVSTFDFSPPTGPHNFFCEFHGGAGMFGYIYVLPPPTITFSPTISETFTITETFSPGPSPTITQSSTSTPTPSPSFTVTPVYAQAPGPNTIMGPVPITAGTPLCLAFSVAPNRSSCELFNSRGDRVAQGKFNGELKQCIETKNLAPGLYFADIEEDDLNQKHSVRRQKIVILP